MTSQCCTPSYWSRCSALHAVNLTQTLEPLLEAPLCTSLHSPPRSLWAPLLAVSLGGSRRAALGWGGTGSWQLASWGSPSWLSASQGYTLFETEPQGRVNVRVCHA